MPSFKGVIRLFIFAFALSLAAIPSSSAFTDPLHVDEPALSQFLESSAFIVNRCQSASTSDCSTDEFDEFVPEGTATVFHVSSECVGRDCENRIPVVYFITAAHVSNPFQKYGCAFSPSSSLLNQQPLYLSRPLRPDQPSSGAWIELVVKAREVSKMGYDCEFKIGASSKPPLKYDVSILRLENAQLFIRTPESTLDAGEELTVEQTLALIGDNYSRHALIATRFMGSEGVGGLSSTGQAYGYFMGYPISFTKEQQECIGTKQGTPARNICLRANTELAYGHTALSVHAENSRPALGMLPRNIVPADHGYLTSLLGADGSISAAEPINRPASAGFSGASMHYFHGGRLHLIGILHGRNITPGRSIECNRLYEQGGAFGGVRPSQCDFVWFTRLDDRQMWRLFVDLAPGDEVSILADKFRNGIFKPADFASVDGLNDLETLWLGISIVRNRAFTEYIVTKKAPPPRTAAFKDLKVIKDGVRADLCPQSSGAGTGGQKRIMNFANFGFEIESHFRRRGFSRIAEMFDDCMDSDAVEQLQLASLGDHWINDGNMRSANTSHEKLPLMTPTLLKFAMIKENPERTKYLQFQKKILGAKHLEHGFLNTQTSEIFEISMSEGWAYDPSTRQEFMKRLSKASALVLLDARILSALAQLKESPHPNLVDDGEVNGTYP